MTKETAPTLASPVPTSATWGDWREPTTVVQRLGDVLQLLCGGKRPPDDVVLAWLDAELDDIGLQHFCAQHGPAWAQGIALIDLAMVAVKQPTEGADHEQVEIEPQVATANDPSYIARLIDSLTMPPQAMVASDLRALHDEAAAMLNLLSCQGLRPKAPPAETALINGLTAEETFATASCSGLTEPRLCDAHAALPDEREDFEAWAKEYGRIFIAKDDSGQYTNQWTREAWVGWQARAAQEWSKA